jgi:hypothetical protein
MVRPIHYSPEENVFGEKGGPIHDFIPVGGYTAVSEMPTYQAAEISACEVSNCRFRTVMK